MSTKLGMGDTHPNRVIAETETEKSFIQNITAAETAVRGTMMYAATPTKQLQPYRTMGELVHTVTQTQSNPTQEDARLRFLLGSISGIVAPLEESLPLAAMASRPAPIANLDPSA